MKAAELQGSQGIAKWDTDGNGLVLGSYEMEVLLDPGFWLALFSVTLIQIALGADNLIIITIIANKLPLDSASGAWELILAMAFRIILLAVVSRILRTRRGVF